jgi:hypothetical protein
MKIVMILTCLFLLVSSCQTELLKTKKKELVFEQKGPITRTINDSTFSYELVNRKWIHVSIINSAEHFSMLVNRFGQKDSIDFDKEHISAKTPEFEWMNNKYICITTWWSGPFSSSLIIPVKRGAEPFKYFVKGILTSDKIRNQVVFSERIFGKEKIQFAIENLETNKKQFVDWKIPSNHSEMPYCDSLCLKNNQLIIWNASKSTTFQLKM